MHTALALPTLRHALRLLVGVGLAVTLAAPVLTAAAQEEVNSSPVAVTPANCAIHLSVANPSPGDQQVPRSVIMSGIAQDRTASSGSGISQVQAFIGNRNEGGTLIGTATFSSVSPGAWTINASIPDSVNGGGDMFVYALSSVSGAEAVVSYPIVIEQDLTATTTTSPEAQSACPVVMAPSTPTSPALALAH